MKMIDWSKVPEGTLIFVWDGDKRPEQPKVDYFDNYRYERCRYPFITTDDSFTHADFVYDSDREKYTIEEKYRPCKNWEEFKQFMGKIAISKNSVVRIIDFVELDTPSSFDYWFSSWTLLEPLNGSKVIGIRED